MPATVASSLRIHRESSNYDEVSMHQSLLFSDGLKDLRNLRSQLYSAAEYFELSYANDDNKHMVVETLKDYAIKALVNTVDHLGSVAYKVDNLLEEKVDDVSRTELRISCIEQRLKTCQEYFNHEGLSQQSLVINTPKYHKRYILPVGQTANGASMTKLKYQGCSLDDEDDWNYFRHAVRATMKETPTTETPISSFRKGFSPSPSSRPSLRLGTFSFTKSMPRGLERRAVSPQQFSLSRSGSMASKPTTPISSRTSTPKTFLDRRQHPAEPKKSASMRLHLDGVHSPKVVERHPSKSKRLLTALLSRRKSKKDEMLYTYLDEY